jgi:four helix bundle protein
MRVQSFEDLLAWQKARALARLIYDITRRREFGRDYALAGQMQRAASSVMANIAEGFDREGPTEFHRFVSIARGSCAEVLSHLYLAHDLGYIADDEFRTIRDAVSEERQILRALRASLERAKARR